jgi:diguanylate cyclase (GGDEF)-like protein/PAS domain S-box-containing protein
LNELFYRSRDISPISIENSNVRDWLVAEKKNAFDAYLNRIISAADGKDRGYMRVKSSVGKIHILEYFNKLKRSADGRPLYVIGTARDVTQRYQKEETIRSLVDNSKEGILLYNKETLEIIYLNSAITKILNCSREELLSRNIYSLFDNAFHKLLTYGIIEKNFGEIEGMELPIKTSQNLSLLCAIRSAEIPFEGQPTPAIYIDDLTEHKKTEKELLNKTIALEDIANKDFLTGLYTRRYVFQYLPRLLHSLSRCTENKTTAIVIFDVNNFKAINDSLGHDTGDKVLAALAEKLNKNIRFSDTAARIGGDEFLLILENVGSSTKEILKKIISALRSITIPELGKIQITISAGARTFSVTEVRKQILKTDEAIKKYIDQLLQQADCAMYEAKEKEENKKNLQKFFLEPLNTDQTPVYTKQSDYAFYKEGTELTKTKKSDNIAFEQRSKVTFKKEDDPIID